MINSGSSPLYGLNFINLSKYETFNPFLLPISDLTQFGEHPASPATITAVFSPAKLAKTTIASGSMANEVSTMKMWLKCPTGKPSLWRRKQLTKVEKITLNSWSSWIGGQVKHSFWIKHEERISSGTSSRSRNAAFARNIADSRIDFLRPLIRTSQALFEGEQISIRQFGEVLQIWITDSRMMVPVRDGTRRCAADFNSEAHLGPEIRYGGELWTAEIRQIVVKSSWSCFGDGFGAGVVTVFRVRELGKRKFSRRESEMELRAWWALLRQTLLNEKLMSYLRVERCWEWKLSSKSTSTRLLFTTL